MRRFEISTFDPMERCYNIKFDRCGQINQMWYLSEFPESFYNTECFENKHFCPNVTTFHAACDAVRPIIDCVNATIYENQCQNDPFYRESIWGLHIDYIRYLCTEPGLTQARDVILNSECYGTDWYTDPDRNVKSAMDACNQDFYQNNSYEDCKKREILILCLAAQVQSECGDSFAALYKVLKKDQLYHSYGMCNN